jgi:hypothetical protein
MGVPARLHALHCATVCCSTKSGWLQHVSYLGNSPQSSRPDFNPAALSGRSSALQERPTPRDPRLRGAFGLRASPPPASQARGFTSTGIPHVPVRGTANRSVARTVDPQSAPLRVRAAASGQRWPATAMTPAPRPRSVARANTMARTILATTRPALAPGATKRPWCRAF